MPGNVDEELRAIVRSELFKHNEKLLCPYALTKMQFMLELHKAQVEYVQEDNNRFNIDTPSIDQAFTWAGTPQGVDFWNNMHSCALAEERRLAGR